MKNDLYPVPKKQELILGSVYLALEMLVLPTALVLLNRQLGSPMTVTAMNCILFVLNFAVTVPIFWRFLQASLEKFLLDLRGSFLAALKGLGLYWLGSFLMSLLILAVDPSFLNVNDANISGMLEENYALLALCTVVLAPVTEELLFRGILFGGLYNRSPLAAFLLSTGAFCAIHVAAYIGLYPPLTLLLCFLQYIPAGLALGWAWTRSGNILSPILMHITINAIGVLAMR